MAKAVGGKRTVRATWHVLERKDGKRERVPKYLRSFVVSEDGALFVSADLPGRFGFLCALSDGVAVMFQPRRGSKQHAYVPAEWMERAYPKARPLIATMRSFAAAEQPAPGT